MAPPVTIPVSVRWDAALLSADTQSQQSAVSAAAMSAIASTRAALASGQLDSAVAAVSGAAQLLNAAASASAAHTITGRRSLAQAQAVTLPAPAAPAAAQQLREDALSVLQAVASSLGLLNNSAAGAAAAGSSAAVQMVPPQQPDSLLALALAAGAVTSVPSELTPTAQARTRGLSLLSLFFFHLVARAAVFSVRWR